MMKRFCGVIAVMLLIFGCEQAQMQQRGIQNKEMAPPKVGDVGKCVVLDTEFPCNPCTASGVTAAKNEAVFVTSPEQVHAVSDGLKTLNFNETRSIAFADQKVNAVQKTIKFEGQTYEYKALIYTSKAMQDRVAQSILTKNGQPASRLEELKLVLAGKIQYPDYAGVWFPAQRVGPVSKKLPLDSTLSKQVIIYDGDGAKVEEVGTLKDGRVIKHITPVNGVAKYFAVEETKILKSKAVETREIQTNDVASGRQEGSKVNLATIREDLGLEPGDEVLKIIVNTQQFTEVEYATKTVFVQKDVNTVVQTAVLYSYLD
jgi:hypothetical protein